jgi:undecaprenyl pyrophosphate phosphatase UppP
MREDDLRNAFLEQAVPDPGTVDAYRRKVKAMIEEKERRLRREHIMTAVIWVMVVLLSTLFLVVAGMRYEGQIKGLELSIQACFWFLFGAVLLLRHLMARNHVAVLKELKGLEMRVIEIQETLGRRS